MAQPPRVNLFLRTRWRRRAGWAKHAGHSRPKKCHPDQLQSLLALALGFAVAGVLATGYQCVTERPASFRLISRGPRHRALAALPLVIFAAPFIIMRNTIRARRLVARRFEFVMLATILAGDRKSVV